MKRYLLFSYQRFYPEGGWNDFTISSDDLEELMAADSSGNLAHIIDSDSMKKIRKAEREVEFDDDSPLVWQECSESVYIPYKTVTLEEKE